MFYRINPIFDEKITGIDSSQAETAIYPVDFDDPLHIWKWNFKEIPDYVPMPIPKVKSKAKLTDLMSVSFTGSSFRLTISNKLKTIFERYNHDKIQYIPINLQFRGKQKTGYWITNILAFDNEECVNYKKSVIKIHGKTPNEDKIVYYESNKEFYNDIKSATIDNPPPMITSLVFNISISKHLVVIDHVKGGGVLYYVSEYLKKEIEEAGCTGIEFQPIEQS